MMYISDNFFIVKCCPHSPLQDGSFRSPLPESASQENDNSAGKMKKSLFLAENNLFFSTAEKIKYLTMTDAKLVWMPDTFFR